jgi:hypothetical protein
MASSPHYDGADVFISCGQLIPGELLMIRGTQYRADESLPRG